MPCSSSDEPGLSIGNKKALDRWGRNLKRAETKAEPLPRHYSTRRRYSLRHLFRWAQVGGHRFALRRLDHNRFQQRPLFIEELDGVAAAGLLANE